MSVTPELSIKTVCIFLKILDCKLSPKIKTQGLVGDFVSRYTRAKVWPPSTIVILLGGADRRLCTTRKCSRRLVELCCRNLYNIARVYVGSWVTCTTRKCSRRLVEFSCRNLVLRLEYHVQECTRSSRYFVPSELFYSNIPYAYLSIYGKYLRYPLRVRTLADGSENW